jgi:integrase
MAGNTSRGIRKRTNAAGQPRYQVRYLIRDPDAPSGWVETSATFPTLREAKAFKSERDNEAALGARRFDPRLGRTPLNRIWTQFSSSKKARGVAEDLERVHPALETAHRTPIRSCTRRRDHPR